MHPHGKPCKGHGWVENIRSYKNLFQQLITVQLAYAFIVIYHTHIVLTLNIRFLIKTIDSSFHFKLFKFSSADFKN